MGKGLVGGDLANSGGNVGRQISKGYDFEDQERGSTRSPERSSRGSSQRRTHGSGSRVDWTKRWFADTSSGFGAARGPSERAHQGEGHSGRNQGGGEADGSDSERSSWSRKRRAASTSNNTEGQSRIPGKKAWSPGGCEAIHILPSCPW